MRSGCPSADRILGAWPLPITFRRHFFERGSCPPNHRLRESCGGGEGKGLGGATLPSAISSAIREEFGTKTEVSHDEGFISARHRGLLFGRRKNPQVRASLNSRATHGPRLPRGTPRFSCQDLPWGLYFFGPLSTAFAQQACPRALNAAPAISGVRPIVGGLHSQRRSRTLGERSKCVQDAILAGFPHRAENRTRT